MKNSKKGGGRNELHGKPELAKKGVISRQTENKSVL